ncbi:hypothetical protein CPB84DRAFT_1735211 [Gymnopilus junonius]|uniref:MYND-type domain-containing protein n=1 Tax=Gymnopilus junonius TaxID=109634 RepID=A0A9P5NFY0_GYMJU|nr:hypothetical protein CPB84DRAFT_1735211 [Gymnopilus junonius]
MAANIIVPKDIPPIFSVLGLACYHCLKERSATSPLLQCGCRHVWYCGPECQKAQWPQHKHLCYAFRAMEMKYAKELLDHYKLVREDPVTHIAEDERELEECLDKVGCLAMDKLEELLKRGLSSDECNVVAWEPHCLACGRSDAIFRIEAYLGNHEPRSPGLKPCPDCGFSFFCSDLHWHTVMSKHQVEPCRYGRENLTQCEMNKISLQDARLSQVVTPGDNVGNFLWLPERTVTSWTSLRSINWIDYESDLAKAYSSHSWRGLSFLKALVRAATENLSMPMTILWSLEVLNDYNDAWTRKDVLNIHVIGASSVEILGARVFEEILHRVPLLKTLKLTFIGPDLKFLTGPNPTVTEMKTCSQCSCFDRRMIHDHHPKYPFNLSFPSCPPIPSSRTYHEFIAEQGNRFIKPDLAIAFDSVCCKGHIASWTHTYQAMFQRKIPSIFTAYNKEEAETEAVLFSGVGINLHPALGPRANPWGSWIWKPDARKLTRFYAVNSWISGGFR